MKQIHKVRLKLSRGLLEYLVGNCVPLNPAFYLLFPTYFLVFVLIILPKRLILLSTYKQMWSGWTIPVFCPTDKPVHVANAGTGLPAVSPAGGRDP